MCDEVLVSAFGPASWLLVFIPPFRQTPACASPSVLVEFHLEGRRGPGPLTSKRHIASTWDANGKQTETKERIRGSEVSVVDETGLQRREGCIYIYIIISKRKASSKSDSLGPPNAVSQAGSGRSCVPRHPAVATSHD